MSLDEEFVTQVTFFFFFCFSFFFFFFLAFGNRTRLDATCNFRIISLRTTPNYLYECSRRQALLRFSTPRFPFLRVEIAQQRIYLYVVTTSVSFCGTQSQAWNAIKRFGASSEILDKPPRKVEKDEGQPGKIHEISVCGPPRGCYVVVPPSCARGRCHSMSSVSFANLEGTVLNISTLHYSVLFCSASS